jgi:hypothetical protein
MGSDCTMSRTREDIVESRRRLRAEYGELFDEISALLFQHDPIGINYGHNTDEYEVETETILPRLSGCRSADDVLLVVHEEFVRCFDTVIAGPRERYAGISSEIWRISQQYRRNRQ